MRSSLRTRRRRRLGCRRPRRVEQVKRLEERYVKRVTSLLRQRFDPDQVSTATELSAIVSSAMTDALRPAHVRIPRGAQRLAQLAVPRAVGVAVDLMIESLERHAPAFLQEARAMREGFENRLYSRWGRALDLADTLRAVALEAGADFHRRHSPAEGDWRYAALVRLHARGCLIGSEVMALLRSGHASGAHARWRSLHEVAVVAVFIEDQETARRYLSHGAIESYRAARDYQRHAAMLGYEPFSNEEMDELATARAKLLNEFGPDFDAQYGWAAHVLGKRPTLRAIEEATDMAHYRPYYRMASHPTHAGPKALDHDLGLIRPEVVMLAGPSNAGLADPGHGMCISLSQLTISLLRQNPNMGDLIAMNVLMALTDAAGDAFIEAHRQLEEDAATEEESAPTE
jgi:hypothetical protein